MPQNIREVSSKLQEVYENLVVKHEDYTKFINDDSAYETDEQWLSECQEIFMRLEVDPKMFAESAEQTSSNDLGKALVKRRIFIVMSRTQFTAAFYH